MTDIPAAVSDQNTTPQNENKVVAPTICTKSSTFEPKFIRKLLPFAAFLITFATVMTVLIIYMDTTAMRHHQFQINMTQDYDLMGVSQDNQELILYVREFLIRSAIDNSAISHRNPNSISQQEIEKNVQPTEKEKYIAELLKNKKYGSFIEAGAYKHNRISDTEWLERNLSWSGLLIQTYPKDLFNLLKRARSRSKYIHACLSTQPHPKEITIPQEVQDGVQINNVQTVYTDDNDWFNTRIKCFPLYTIMLAVNLTNLDFLSLETDCNEYEVLQTLPFNLVNVKVISVHFQSCNSFKSDESSFNNLKRLLTINKFTFKKRFVDDYIFVAKN